MEGRIKLTISSSNTVSKTIKVINEQYDLWSCKASHFDLSGSTTACPMNIPFSTVLPTTFKFKDGDREFPLPPSYEVNFTGMPGLYAKCTYAICGIVKIHGLLWDHKKIVSTPFIYRPRTHPRQPIVTTSFLSSVKSLPEEWFQATSLLKPRPGTNPSLGSLNVNFFLPAVRTFGLRDSIPYHIQISGSISSLKEFHSNVQYNLDSESLSSSPLRSRSNNLTLTMSVSLRRQVRVDVKSQSVRKGSLIGTGTLNAVAPPIELDLTLHSLQEMTLDWEGTVRCRPEICVGHFDARNLSATDFLMFSIQPKTTHRVFDPLQIIVPISLVTDTWVEH